MAHRIVSTNPTDLDLAASVLREGGLVAFPTETVYGLGANALDASAVARIFEAKQRPHFDPLITHIASREDVSRVARDVQPVINELIDAFWPGPLTLVLPKHDAVPALVTSGLDTVGVRVPSHPVARHLIDVAGMPIAAPSANKFGRLSPVNAQHVVDGLGDAVDVVIDGGPTMHGVESTIVDASDGDHVRVLRQGAISEEELQLILGSRLVSVSESEMKNEAPVGPGQLPNHYAPNTRLIVVNSVEEVPDVDVATSAYLAFSTPPRFHDFAAKEVLSREGDVREAAARLFDVLHRLDANEVSVIYAEWAPHEGVGRAINDRLRRAAATWS